MKVVGSRRGLSLLQTLQLDPLKAPVVQDMEGLRPVLIWDLLCQRDRGRMYRIYLGPGHYLGQGGGV